MSDSTLVTGSPFGAQGPSKGSVLGERWEVRDLEEGDGLFLTFRAVDQESDAVVLMRVMAPGLLGDRDARLMAERLRKLIKKGGGTLNPILEVDRENATLFSVEPYPTGASLRSVLEARRQKGQPLSPAEILPVVARLESALAGIPDPYFHGDLRPQRIFVAPDRVLITGGFFLSVMPGDPLVDALSRDIPLRRQFAPEVGDGLAGRPSDRWSVGALVWEALVGAAPQPGPKMPPARLGAVGPVLLKYLDADPAQRPPSLGPLVDALAAAAGVPRPATTPEPFGLAAEEVTSEQTELAMRPETETTELEAPRTEPGVNDTIRLPALDEQGRVKGKRDLDGIDPALLQAAAAGRKISDSGTFELDGRELEKLAKDEKKRSNSSSDLDPRLVRAALGVSAEPSSDEIEAPPQPRPKRKQSVTQELDASDLQDVAEPKTKTTAKKATSMPAPAARAQQPAAKVAPAAAPRPAPAPKPMPMAAPAPLPVLAPQPMPSVAPAPSPTPMLAPQPQPAPAMQAPAPPRTSHPPQAARPAVPARAEGPSGTMIVGGAVLIALLILAAALGYRHYQDAAAREMRIDSRLRAIGTGAP